MRNFKVLSLLIVFLLAFSFVMVSPVFAESGSGSEDDYDADEISESDDSEVKTQEDESDDSANSDSDDSNDEDSSGSSNKTEVRTEERVRNADGTETRIERRVREKDGEIEIREKVRIKSEDTKNRCEQFKERIDKVKDNSELTDERKKLLIKTLEESIETCKRAKEVNEERDETRVKIREQCGILGERIFELAINLGDITRSTDRAVIVESIRDLKEEHKECIGEEVKFELREKVKHEVKPAVRNACFDRDELQETIETLRERVESIEDEDIQKGAREKLHFLEERLKEAAQKCDKKEDIQELQCERFVKIQSHFDGLEDKVQELNQTNRLENLKKELVEVREKCRAEKIKDHDFDDFKDLEIIFKSKFETILESADGTLIDELEDLELEKKELIREFAKKFKRLEAKKNGIIKKFKFKVRQVFADDQEVEAQEIEIEIEGETLNVEIGDAIILNEGNVSVETEEELEYENGELVSSKSKRKIRILPSKLKELVRGKLSEARLEEIGETLRYRAKTREEGRLFGFIPVSFHEETDIDAETGEIIDQRRPLWTFLVAG